MSPIAYTRFGLVVVEITDPKAKIDGGDVQYTGKEILVGVSQRTNLAGVRAVAEAFPGYKTIPIPVSGPLHLKTLIGLCGEDTFCVATESLDSIKMFERIRDLSSIPYKAIYVPEDNVANTIWINGRVICKSRKENPRSFEILQKHSCHQLVEIESSEIEKAVGSLTCMSLRFNRPKSIAPANVEDHTPQVEVLSPVKSFVPDQNRIHDKLEAIAKKNVLSTTNTTHSPTVTATGGNSNSGSDTER